MNIKVNKKKLLLQEIYGVDPHFVGNPTFDGGFFGFGGNRQIIQKDPQVEKIRKQEESEVNQNIQDQNWTMGKNNWEKHLNLQDVNTDNIEDQIDLPLSRVTEERNAADSNYTHLPGSPAINAIENPQLHVPGAGRPDGTDEYLLDDELPGGYKHEYPNAEHLPLGGMGMVITPKQFVPENEPNQYVHQESKKRKEKRREQQKVNVDKNIQTIKRYLNLLRSAKSGDAINFAAKLDIEVNNLEKKIKTHEQTIGLNELSSMINEIIESELKNDKY